MLEIYRFFILKIFYNSKKSLFFLIKYLFILILFLLKINYKFEFIILFLKYKFEIRSSILY